MMLIPTRRAWALVLPALLLTGCSTSQTSWRNPETLFGLLTPYRIDVVQGNVVTQEVLAQIQPGLGRLQVREILGTPLLADPFHADRWDYVFTIRRQGVPDQKRRVTVHFNGDTVARFEAGEMPSEREFVASIDRPVKGRNPKPDLTPEQVAALPAPPKAEVVRKAPEGAVRTYPPLERGQP
ncbi:outer membrane protein assembly factor BamE [Aquabacterium fontiphilum]|uniref:outer membrane protein assembly factor BamE n=1 Tax=Aquabacterium fontiphilum TaxID=450365 RepID=UPI001F02DFB0|nr:outer membrane protein assembly factor BamE [Aquabacterium fontiphilum]